MVEHSKKVIMYLKHFIKYKLGINDNNRNKIIKIENKIIKNKKVNPHL